MFKQNIKEKTVLLINFILIIATSCNLTAKELVITFDDLPYNVDLNVSELDARTKTILDILDRYRIKTIGFVNEEKLYRDNYTQRVQILEQWLQSGHDLGNHTYSHADFHQLSLPEFKSEVINGENFIKKLMTQYDKKLKYFRYPYSHAGLTTDSRGEFVSFLEKNGYKIAPLTIDTDDWVLDQYYVKALEAGDEAKAKTIEQEYLAHTEAKFAFYDRITLEMFGRNIAHIWILHANTINAKLLDKLLDIAKQYGYTFITLDEALQDNAYDSLDNYFGSFGPSWLYRWDYSDKKKINWSGDPDPKI